ncbi:MAG TPA: hypothetical protein VET30_00975, partial [Pseudoxanthomonas sp.]|nr:hypothetical protein [Pseudoxanthomonas sp.]
MNAVRKPKKAAKSTSSKDTKSSDAKPAAAAPRKTAAAKVAAPRVGSFSLEPIFAALRKRLPAARQAEAKAFAESF